MILIAIGDCFRAFLIGPVLRELQARGVAHRIALAAPEAELARLRQPFDTETSSRAVATEEAARQFADELLSASPTCIAYLGITAFTLYLAQQAALRGVRVVHLDAGVRAFGGIPAVETPWADAWCVAGDLERSVLLQNGAATDAIAVVGDLVAEAVAAVQRPEVDAPEGVALAFERDATEFATWQQRLEPTKLPILPPPPRDARLDAWISYVARARVVFTDSVGWQRVAVTLGVPCVVRPTAGLWARGVAAGLVTQRELTRDGMARSLQQAARQARGTPLVATGVGARVADVLVTRASPAPLTLPSDGDASGRTFSNDEAALVTMVLQRGTLNSTRGTMVTTFEQRFAQWLGRKHAIACASGSAAIHCAIAALQLQPGDEVITTPITDMGALTPILYEGAVPVFADVEPVSLNVTADTIRAQLTDRTRAIVVTHLFGLPCDMRPIQALADQRGIPVIEDGAQAFGATIGKRKVGTFGALAAFSLQQGKHITSGEGGIVATDDDALARRVFLFVNKAWGYGDSKPDHYFPALNYRLTELQGAVLVAQLPKLDDVVARRRDVAASLLEALAGLRGLTLPDDPEHGTHSYWKFAFHVDAAVIPGGAPALGKRMQAAGVACVPRYIQKPAFECALFQDWKASPVTWLPLQHNPRRERAASMFARADYPGAVKALDGVIVLPINERYTQAHVDLVANTIRSAVQELARG